MTYAQEQCACGMVARVPVGELLPYGWERDYTKSGISVCTRCLDELEHRRRYGNHDDDTRTRARGRDDA